MVCNLKRQDFTRRIKTIQTDNGLCNVVGFYLFFVGVNVFFRRGSAAVNMISSAISFASFFLGHFASWSSE